MHTTLKEVLYRPIKKYPSLSWDGRNVDSADHVEVDLSLADHSEIGTASCQKAKDLLTVMVFHGTDDKETIAKNFKELNDELVELRAKESR